MGSLLIKKIMVVLGGYANKSLIPLIHTVVTKLYHSLISLLRKCILSLNYLRKLQWESQYIIVHAEYESV